MGDILNGDGIAAVLIVHNRQLVLATIIADRTETILIVYLECGEILSAYRCYGEGDRAVLADFSLRLGIVRCTLDIGNRPAVAACRDCKACIPLKRNLNCSRLAQIFDGECVGQVILNRAVDRPLLYHVVCFRSDSQNDLFALLYLNTGIGGGVDGLKCIAVASLSGQRAICAADRFQRNKLACRKVCCNCVRLGHIVQRQIQTAVALGFAVQRPAGQILVFIRYCGEDYIGVTVYRQLAVCDCCVRAVDRCGDMTETGRADRNLVGRNFFKFHIDICRIGQIGNGVAVLFGCRSGDCGRAVSRRIPALDLITILRLCRKDDGRAGRLLCAGGERLRSVLCSQRTVFRSDTVVYRVGYGIQRICCGNRGVLCNVECERFTRFLALFTVYGPACEGIAGCALRFCREGNTRVADNRIAVCKRRVACRCRYGAVRCGEVHRIRLADDLDLHIHADIMGHFVRKGHTGCTVLLSAVHIPAFYLVAVIQAGNGKGDGATGVRRGAACKVGFRAAVRLEGGLKLCLMRRSIRAVFLEVVGHLVAQRVKLDLNRLRRGDLIVNRKRRLAVLLFAVELPYAGLIAGIRRCGEGNDRVAVNHERAIFRIGYSVAVHVLAGDSRLERAVRAAGSVRRLVDDRPLDRSSRDCRPDRRDGLVALHIADGVGLVIGCSAGAVGVYRRNALHRADLVARIRCQRNGQAGAEVYMVVSLQRGICRAVYSALDFNCTARSGLNRYYRLFHKGCSAGGVCIDRNILHLLYTVRLAGIRCARAAGLFALSPDCLYIRCNIIIVRRCGYGCLRAGVDIFFAACFFRLYRFTIQRVGNADRAVFRRIHRHNRLRPNHHVDRSFRGQAVDGVGEGFAVAVCRYLLTVYLPRYNLIRGRLFIGKRDAAVGRATVAAGDGCIVCGILCGQRAALDSFTALVYDTERHLCRLCVVVDQCAYPDIASQILNRVVQSGNVRVGPCTALGGLVLPAGNAHCGGRLCGQRNRRALFALAVGQTGRFKVQSNRRVRIFLLYSGIVYGVLCRLLKGYIDPGIRGDGQFQLLSAENRIICVRLGFGFSIARNRPLIYNIAGIRRCGKGNLGAAEYGVGDGTAVCRGSDRTVFTALRRHRVEPVGEFNVYIQIVIQTGNGQRLFISGEGVLGHACRHFIAVDRPLPNLIVFCRCSDESHLAAAGDLGTVFKEG